MSTASQKFIRQTGQHGYIFLKVLSDELKEVGATNVEVVWITVVRSAYVIEELLSHV